MATVEQARAALNAVKDAGSGRDLIELGWIQEPRLQGERAVIRLALPGFAQSQRDRIVADAGEKYHVPSQFELVDPRLSTDRLKFL